MKHKLVRSPSENRQQTEARILRSAEKIFASKGFSGSSMDAIASDAKLSKQNLIYYFQSKQVLYRSVLQNVIDLWMEKMTLIEDSDLSPQDIIKTYVRQKIELSRDYPNASKVFAHEIISGAPILKDYISTKVKPQFERDVAVINGWAKDGLIEPISAEHMFFTIWASTQTYADFATQIQQLLGKSELEERDFEQAADFISQSIIQAYLKPPKPKPLS